MNKRMLDIIDEFINPENYNTWCQLNGQTIQENYILQKKKLRKQVLSRELKKLLDEEMSDMDAAVSNIKFTIKSEVK